VAEVNLPVAALIWLMIVPMLLKIDFAVGIQSDTEEGLVALRARLEPADISGTEQRATACCCARSDKNMGAGPPGHRLGDVPHPGLDPDLRRWPGARPTGAQRRGKCLLRLYFMLTLYGFPLEYSRVFPR
jgi:hypothetical protein